jgi:hypothetical protein
VVLLKLLSKINLLLNKHPRLPVKHRRPLAELKLDEPHLPLGQLNLLHNVLVKLLSVLVKLHNVRVKHNVLLNVFKYYI